MYWKSIICTLSYHTWKNIWQAWLQMSLYSPHRDSNPRLRFRGIFYSEKSKGGAECWIERHLAVGSYKTSPISTLTFESAKNKWQQMMTKKYKMLRLHSVSFYSRYKSVCASSGKFRSQNALVADICTSTTSCWVFSLSLSNHMEGPRESVCLFIFNS